MDIAESIRLHTQQQVRPAVQQQVQKKQDFDTLLKLITGIAGIIVIVGAFRK